MTLPPPLRGIIPPLCTPLTAEDEVDVASLRRLLDWQLDAGVAGVFVLGSSGEVALLSDRLRQTVIETAVDHVAGRVPVLAGVIDTATLRVADHVRAAAAAGVDAVVVTAPFYTRTHPTEVEAHFRRIGDLCPVPIVAYDIPIAVGSKLPVELIAALARDGVISAVKDSSGDDIALRRLVRAVQAGGPAGFSILTGSELMVDAALAYGVDGCVPGLGNVDPHGYVRLYRACREQRWEDARREQDRLADLFSIVDLAPADAMGRGSAALGAFKAALQLRGIIADPHTAPPYRRLSDADRAAIADRLRALDLL